MKDITKLVLAIEVNS